MNTYLGEESLLRLCDNMIANLNAIRMVCLHHLDLGTQIPPSKLDHLKKRLFTLLATSLRQGYLVEISSTREVTSM